MHRIDVGVALSAKNLPSLLWEIIHSLTPEQTEVIVGNDGSDYNTSTLLATLAGSFPLL